MKSDKLPAMPFYTGDWLKHTTLRTLPPDIRGLYIDLLCYMWNSSERGVLVDNNGNPFSENDIIRLVGLDNQNSSKWLSILLSKGIIEKQDNGGAIYSKRMVKDEELRKIRKITGKKGGNPILLNQGDNLITEDENEIKDIKEIIEYLNNRIKSNYKHTTAKTRKFIKSRFNEDFTVENFITVIDKKADEWQGTDMEKYLRPETLFGNKFEGYLNQKIIKKAKSIIDQMHDDLKRRRERDDRERVQ